MQTLARIVAVGAVFAALGPALAADKEAAGTLERAIRAHGGAGALAKTLTCKRTDRGTQAVLDREETFVSQVYRQLPDNLRLQIEMGKNFKTTIVVAGDTGYQSDNRGPAVKMLSQRTREVREEAYLWWVTTLVPLTGPGFTLSALPPTKFDGVEVVGIKVEHKGNADTRLYFGKRSGLLVRAERRVFEAGLAVDKEYTYGSHKSISGVVLHTKEVVYMNKKKLTEFTIGDYSFPDKFPASVFAKP